MGRFLQVGLLVVMIAALIQGPPLCSDEVVNVNCFYDRSGDDETAYCLQPAGQSNGQTHLTSSQVNGLEAVSCPLSFEMIAIFSNKDDIIINTECTGLSLSINQSVYVNTNVSRVRVVCDETSTFKTISGPSDAFETLRQNINLLTTQCECVERAAAAWSLGAVLTDESNAWLWILEQASPQSCATSTIPRDAYLAPGELKSAGNPTKTSILS
ncbi:uncharacterized protein [Oscarella lobularis]|uniref:uncharacterized protein isoform X1 n=1 Tax=Oscarella lobularis TaxID=121494 RepID=UPI0033138232